MKKKIITGVTAALMAIGVVVGVASTASATISFQGVTPANQYVYGTGYWTASWSGSGTYPASFDTGDGVTFVFGNQTNSGVNYPQWGFPPSCSAHYKQTYKVSTAKVYANTYVQC